MIEITVTREGDEQLVRSFEGSRISIGRGDDNDLVLGSHQCSRHHAEIVREGTLYKIRDLDSVNGVRWASQRITEFTLVDGMSVRLGPYTLAIALPAIEIPGDQTGTLPPDVAEDRALVLRDAQDEASKLHEESSIPATPSAGRAELYLIYKRNDQIQSLKIVEGVRYVIGRAPDADLVLDDKQCSKYHASIFSIGSEFRIQDNNSSNGTILRDQRIEEAVLTPNSEIVIGRSVITAGRERKDLEDDAALLEHTMLGAPSPASIESQRRHWPTRWGIGTMAALTALAAGVFMLRDNDSQTLDGVEEAASVTTGEPMAIPAGELIVQVATVATKELIRSVDGAATISPLRRVTVGAEVAGQIRALPIDEGVRVTRGQLLAQVNDNDIRLQIEEARSASSEDRLNLARDDYERKQRLFNDGVVTRSVVDQARHQYLALETAFDSNQATIRRLEEQLQKTRILAPISGHVANLSVSAGEFLTPGIPVAVLEDTNEVFAELEVTDRDIVQIQKGQSVEVITDAFPERIFQGVVDNVSSVAHPVTRTFNIEARIRNQDGSLRTGMIASLRVILSTNLGPVIPIDALMDRRGDDGSVFVVSDGKAHLVPVRLGTEVDQEIEVLDGLAEDDEVIIYGMERIRDQQRINTYERR